MTHHLRTTIEQSQHFPKPKIMGVLNVTPDSFYDGGRWLNKEAALRHAENMVKFGADIIDVGGESTRPGAVEVSLAEELDRVIPIIERLDALIDSPISIDTCKPQVMYEAIQAGATVVNDVKALAHPEAIKIVSLAQVKVCLMHMQGEPGTMQHSPNYEQDIIIEIHNFFANKIEQCVSAGIAKTNIIIDPGFGFGKNLYHNMRIINQLSQFSCLGVEMLLGVSRKFSIGEILQCPVEERLAGSLALALIAVNNGASIIRTHDVSATVQALTVLWSVRNEVEMGYT